MLSYASRALFRASALRASPFVRKDIRNIAVIAHVDHGKTTMVDNMMKFATGRQGEADSVLDCFAQERERGITILAKNTSIPLLGHPATLNVVDTPGHLDFGGEVERTLQMVESFLLLVDAADGVMPGTRYVLRKALELRLRPLVFINKVDREVGDIPRTIAAVEDLFLDMIVDESQLDYPVLFGSGKSGIALTEMPKACGPGALAGGGSLQPLFDAIYKHVPPPVSRSEDPNEVSMLVTNLGQEPRIGQTAVIRVMSGNDIQIGPKGTPVKVYSGANKSHSAEVTIASALVFNGASMEPRTTIGVGDIVRVSGLPPLGIGDTIYRAKPGGEPPLLPYKQCDPPALLLPVTVNQASHRGEETDVKDGISYSILRERLFTEAKTNLALRVTEREGEKMLDVAGRGALHLGVLFEDLRREGFELEFRKPTVITETIDGVVHEPLDMLYIDVNGSKVEELTTLLNARGVDVDDLIVKGDRAVVKGKATTRQMLGFQNDFLTLTKGDGVWRSEFLKWTPLEGKEPARPRGAMVVQTAGRATGYGLDSLKKHGTFFVDEGMTVRDMQVVGECYGNQDMICNVSKPPPEKGSRDGAGVKGGYESRQLTLEEAIMWIDRTELVEVRPLLFLDGCDCEACLSRAD